MSRLKGKNSKLNQGTSQHQRLCVDSILGLEPGPQKPPWCSYSTLGLLLHPKLKQQEDPKAQNQKKT